MNSYHIRYTNAAPAGFEVKEEDVPIESNDKWYLFKDERSMKLFLNWTVLKHLGLVALPIEDRIEFYEREPWDSSFLEERGSHKPLLIVIRTDGFNLLKNDYDNIEGSF